MFPSVNKFLSGILRNSGFQIRRLSSQVKYETKSVTPSLRPYEELSVISPGKLKIPRKPFSMTVQYIDSSPKEKKKQTVIAIHGTPGSCQHYEAMANSFLQSYDDVRFVAVSLPEFSHTRENGYFWHSTLERANFVRQFLYDMNIDTVDSLVCHSFGIHATVALWDRPENLTIKSLCMFAPQPFWERKYLYYAQNKRHLYMFHNKLWFKLLDMIEIHKLGKQPLKFQNANDMLLFCCTQFDKLLLNFEERYRRVVSNTNTPVSVMYGEREKLIYKENSAKFNSILGMGPDQIVRLDPKNHTGNDVKDNGGRVNSYVVEDAGHLLHITHQQFSRKVLTNLLEKVRSP